MNFEEYMDREFLHSKNSYLIDIHTSFIENTSAVQISSERVLNGLMEFEALGKQIHNDLQSKKDISKPAEQSVNVFQTLRYDLRAFYFFVRALMDDFCKILKAKKGKSREQIPESMNTLLGWISKNRKNRYENQFFALLLQELAWFPEFREERNKLKKGSHAIRTVTDSRGTLYKVSNFNDTIGDANSKSIVKFVGDTNKNVSEFKAFLLSWLLKE